ncbi:MAG: hypothetical protein V1853_03290 [bacterium]
MNKIPEWQYPLYKKSDQVAYNLLSRLGKSKKYPELIGQDKEVNKFLKLLLLSQKMKDYRKFRDIVLKELLKKKVDVSKLLIKGGQLKIPKDIDKSWAVFTQDRRICQLIDQLGGADIQFRGNRKEVIEFVVRFWLSQLLTDWRGPIMAVLLECLKNRTTLISRLNKLLQNWDYTKIF